VIAQKALGLKPSEVYGMHINNWKALAGQGEVTPWISVEDRLPENTKRVNVLFNNGYKKDCKAMAEYIAKMSVLAEDYISEEYSDFTDYDKENDRHYAPEGWYEWNHSSDICMHMGDTKVTHWMPIPTLPAKEVE
jgi:hypothetical protein